MNNLTIRTITGFFFVVVLIGSILLHPFAYLAVFLLIVIGSLTEFYRLVRARNINVLEIYGIICAVLIFATTFFSACGYLNHKYLLLLIPLVFVIPATGLFLKKPDPFNTIVWTLFGLFYIAFPLSLLNYIRFYPGNSHILIAYFIIIWTYDTAAYLVGITAGKHRLFERVSPKKSWEGAIGGAFITLVIAWLISGYFAPIGAIRFIVLSAIIIVAGTLGDLVESLLKRETGVKDSGNLLPGHGGFLDRFDAILLTSPFVFTYLQLFC